MRNMAMSEVTYISHIINNKNKAHFDLPQPIFDIFFFKQLRACVRACVRVCVCVCVCVLLTQ